MNSSTAQAIRMSVLYVSVASVLIALIYFIWSGSVAEGIAYTERLQSCIDSGGSWLYSACIQN
jgi:hypothetical protein